MVKCTCKQCKKEFKVYPSRIKKGGGIFCSKSCRATYYNLKDNPTNDPKVKEKISKNHANVSGKNNPMYGVKLSGKENSQYIDGRSKYSSYYRFIAYENFKHECVECGKKDKNKEFHVHHIDGDRENNSLDNLEILCPSCHNNIRHKLSRNELGQFKGELK